MGADTQNVWDVLLGVSGFTDELTELAASREDVLLCDELAL